MFQKNICKVDVEKEMATTIPLFRTAVYMILIIFFMISPASPGEHSGILSRLYKQASKQNRPLIIVLDNSAREKSKSVKYKSSVEVDENMSIPLMYMYQFDQSQQKLQPVKLPMSKLLENENDKVVKRPVKKRVKPKHNYFNKADDKIFLRAPVIKSLLRISKSLRCDAQNDCEDNCKDKYNGKKRDECEDECEIKYSCEESVEEKEKEKEKDECTEPNSCEEHEMSTQGERLITVTPKCKRC